MRIFQQYITACKAIQQHKLVSNSRVIGCEDRLRNDLYCVRWGVKLRSINQYHKCFIIKSNSGRNKTHENTEYYKKTSATTTTTNS